MHPVGLVTVVSYFLLLHHTPWISALVSCMEISCMVVSRPFISISSYGLTLLTTSVSEAFHLKYT